MFDAASKEWQRNGDILGTWRTIAATVDEVNEKIFNNELSPDRCDCPPTATCAGNHSCFCGMCGEPTVCSDLRDHYMGYRACGPCRQGQATFPSSWASAIAERGVVPGSRFSKRPNHDGADKGIHRGEPILCREAPGELLKVFGYQRSWIYAVLPLRRLYVLPPSLGFGQPSAQASHVNTQDGMGYPKGPRRSQGVGRVSTYEPTATVSRSRT